MIVNNFIRGHFDLLSTTLDIHGDPPHLLKATLSADLYFLILEFSCNIDFQSCTDLFEDMTLFDSRKYFYFKALLKCRVAVVVFF